MYKVVNISDLDSTDNFIESDKVIQIDSNRTKMRVADNDYAHKCKSYLSDCIDTTDSALNSYISTINNINSTYFTTELTSVYIKNGNLIKQSTLNRIMTTEAFLTKEGCKALETKCVAYIDELKNKAVSIMMAQLNKSFIKQNSAGRLAYGQKVVESTTLRTDYVYDITQDGLPTSHNYNFETGEFSFAHLLFGPSVKNKTTSSTSSDALSFFVEDAWADYYDVTAKSFILTGSAGQMLGHELSSYTLFSIQGSNNFKISVPSASYDFEKNETIPIAKFVETFLRRQIKKVIKNVCDNYLSNMYSVPEFVRK